MGHMNIIIKMDIEAQKIGLVSFSSNVTLHPTQIRAARDQKTLLNIGKRFLRQIGVITKDMDGIKLHRKSYRSQQKLCKYVRIS